MVVFNALNMTNIEPIVDLQLEEVRDRLADRRITLDVTPAAMEHLSSTATIPSSERVR